MDDEQLRAARDRLRSRYGQAIAEKASDDFCRAFGREADFEGGEGEAIVELAPEPAVAAPEAGADPATWQAVHAAVTSLRERHGLPLRADLLLRQARITALREDFYRAAGQIGAAFGRAESSQDTGPEYCWLNRSMRIPTVSETLAEVAADPLVRVVDVPLPMLPELTVTTVTVGAAAYRQRSARTGAGVIVAVIDGEVRLDHPYLKDRVIHRHNHVREPWGRPSAHGTAVAGIIGADGERLQGVAPAATIYAYKVFATDPLLGSTDFDGALALEKALEDGAHIANCSWGVGPVGAAPSRIARACDTAWGAGMTVVKSAGNHPPGGTMVTAPAEADGVIVVGGTNRAGEFLGRYSNFGPTPAGQPRPHLLAPGGADGDSIVSCWTNGDVGAIGGPGTSFAAPHVSGLLALVLEGQPDLTPAQQRDLLVSTCTPLSTVDASRQGAGLVSLAGLE
jgi:serine protease AprX